MLNRLLTTRCKLDLRDYCDHSAALQLMSDADALCLLLSAVPGAERVAPAKLFEYLALGLPILIPPNRLWAKTMGAHGGGMMYELTPADAAAANVRKTLEACRFYPNGIPVDVQWAGEGKKLWRLLDSFI